MTQMAQSRKVPLILVGGGGHCKSCIDVIEQEGKCEIRGIVDIPDREGEKVLGYEIVGSDSDLSALVREYPFFLITLGQIKTPRKRVALFEKILGLGGRFPVIVSPHAYVSSHAKVGSGTVVMHHALINAAAVVGKNCIINSKALIEHDAVVQDHCHIATAAVINGGTTVGEKSFWGSNAVGREGIRVAAQSVIPAGERVFISGNIEYTGKSQPESD